MKIKRLIIAIFFSSIFFSCAMNGTENAEDNRENAGGDFLRSRIESQFNETVWLEGLSSSAKKTLASNVPGAKKGIPATPETASATDTAADAPIFPYIEGFGILDSSSLSAEAKSALDGFCAALASGNDASGFMTESRKYEFSIFLFDLKENYQSIFGVDFPENAIFDSWKYAAPVFGDDFFLVIVRFFANKKYFDAEIYLDESENGWRVNQIRARKGARQNE